MKFISCQKCNISKFNNVAWCAEVCMKPINILEVVMEYFNNPNTYPEDLESDLYDIIKSEGEDE